MRSPPTVVQRLRSPARATSSPGFTLIELLNNLKQLSLAIHSYEDRHSQVPESVKEKEVDRTTITLAEGWLKQLCDLETEGQALLAGIDRLSRTAGAEDGRLLAQTRGPLETMVRETGSSLEKSFAKLRLERARVCPVAT